VIVVHVASPVSSAPPRNLAGRRALPAVLGVAIAAELLCLTVLALGAMSGGQALVPSTRNASPGWLQGPLPAIDAGLSSADMGALLVAMVLGYGIVLALAPHVRGRWPVVAAVVAVALSGLAPPLLSADLFGYIAWGELGARGVNPYSHPSVAVGDDHPVRPFLLWNHGSTPYGPLFITLMFGAAPLSVAAALWSLKALAALSALACMALLWRAAARLGRSPAQAALAFGLNPIVLVYGIGGAHNDLLVGAVVIAGVLAVVCGRERAGAGAVVAAGAMKASALVVLPFLIAGSKDWRRTALAALATGAVLATGAFALFGAPLLNLVGALAAQQEMVALHSVPSQLAMLAGADELPPWGRLVGNALLLVTVVGLLVAVRRGGDWLSGAGWAYVALLLTTAWLLPWYIAWVVPFAALAGDRRLLGATWALTMLFVFVRLPMLD
jgi:hypothetical protein